MTSRLLPGNPNSALMSVKDEGTLRALSSFSSSIMAATRCRSLVRWSRVTAGTCP